MSRATIDKIDRMPGTVQNSIGCVYGGYANADQSVVAFNCSKDVGLMKCATDPGAHERLVCESGSCTPNGIFDLRLSYCENKPG